MGTNNPSCNMDAEDKIFINYEDMGVIMSDICQLVENSDWTPELIVGISRGGLTPGVMISHYFDLPFKPLMWSSRDHVNRVSDLTLAEAAADGLNILLVDDICDTGDTLSEVRQDWIESAEGIVWGPGGNVRTACVAIRAGCHFEVDYPGEFIDGKDWLYFPWETWAC